MIALTRIAMLALLHIPTVTPAPIPVTPTPEPLLAYISLTQAKDWVETLKGIVEIIAIAVAGWL